MNKEEQNGKNKVRKTGVVYLSTIPPFMNVTRITEIMSKFGKVGRVFLQPSVSKAEKAKKIKKKIKKGLYFTEGWVEFLRKRVAKEVAATLNNTQVSNQKKSKHYDLVWNIKYLPRFKWVHLSERLEYERAVYKHRMRAEIAQVKREANHFAETVELSEKRKKKINQQEQFGIEYKQRKTDDEILKSKEESNKSEDRTEFLKGLFGS